MRLSSKTRNLLIHHNRYQPSPTTTPQVKALLSRNRVALDALVELLLEREKVKGEEIVEVGHLDA